MKLALDTNAYTDLAKGVPRVASVVATAAHVYLPFTVVAELRAGFAVGTRGPDNERVLSQFLTKPNVAILFPDDQTIVQYALLFKQLRGAGKMIPANDLWIAAMVQHGLTLCTRDSHFDHLPQISRA
jgi:predicted nucleic acid-binding protein